MRISYVARNRKYERFAGALSKVGLVVYKVDIRTYIHKRIQTRNNPFWGGSLEPVSSSCSILFPSPPLILSFSFIPGISRLPTLLPSLLSLSFVYTPYIFRVMYLCVLSLSIERGECSCAMLVHVQQPRLDLGRAPSFVWDDYHPLPLPFTLAKRARSIAID